jgi:polyferredoxin
MIYRLLADLVVVVHFLYVTSVVLGLVAILLGWMLNWEWVRNRWFRGMHLAMILLVVVEAWLGIMCPLTVWEQQLRSKAGQQTYQGDFIARWVHDAMFFEAEPWVFTVCYSLFGGLVLATLFLVKPRWRSSRQDGTA